MPEPSPPIVNDGRTTTGYFNISAPEMHSSMVWQITDLAEEPPIFSTIPLKVSRSSPRLIAGMSAPINLTPKRSSEPRS